MTLADANLRKLDLGRVFGDTFGVIRRQAGPLIGVTVALSYLPALLNALISRSALRGAQPTPFAPFATYNNPLYGLLGLGILVLSAYAIACQLNIAIGDLEERHPVLSDVIRAAGGKILPMIGAILLMALGVMLGAVLFLVPGIIFGVMWVVALPAIVADTSNPVKALGRSRALTKGNRWRIFGLLILLWALILVVEGVFFGATPAPGMRGVMIGAPPSPNANFLSLAMYYLVASAFSLCISIGSAALYVQLRELKGAGGESVAQVFA